jgi:hypothetical protein
MFQALLAHLQEALHKRHLVYCLRVMSVGCTWCNIPSAVCIAPPEDEQVVLETTHPQYSIDRSSIENLSEGTRNAP